ncbi:MAG: alpha/beta fold hydrolase [Streptosporangiaceae bacterium]
MTLRVRHRPGGRLPPFLLVHGMAANARVWDEVAEVLAGKGHAVYAVDLRGHGESDSPDHGHDTATAAADLAGLCSRLGLSRAVVAGHSWGGHVAVRLAAEQPDLVAALALLDGGWLDPSAAFGSWDRYSASLPRPNLARLSPDGVRDSLRAIHPTWSPTAVEASMASMTVHPDGSLSPRPTADRQAEILRSIWDDPPARYFPAITAPVLLMPALPKGIDRRWAQRIRSVVESAAAALPSASIREYLDSDHDLHAQHPARVAADLLSLAGSLTAR